MSRLHLHYYKHPLLTNDQDVDSSMLREKILFRENKVTAQKILKNKKIKYRNK